MNRRIKILTLLALVCSAFGAIAIQNSAFAAYGKNDTLVVKALEQGLFKCINGDGTNGGLKSPVELTTEVRFSGELIADDTINNGNSVSIYLPGTKSINCKDLLSDTSGVSDKYTTISGGLLTGMYTNSLNSAQSRMTALGYKEETSPNDDDASQSSSSIVFHFDIDGNKDFISLNYDIDDNGIARISRGGGDVITDFYNICPEEISRNYTDECGRNKFAIKYEDGIFKYVSSGTGGASAQMDILPTLFASAEAEMKWNELKEFVNQDLGSFLDNYIDKEKRVIFTNIEYKDGERTEKSTDYWVKTSSPFQIALESLFGDSKKTPIAFSEYEVIGLYQNYFQQNMEYYCGDDEAMHNSYPTYKKSLHLIVDGGYKDCSYKLKDGGTSGDIASIKVNSAQSGGFMGAPIGLNEVIEHLNETTLSAEDISKVESLAESNRGGGNADEESTEKESDPCYDSGLVSQTWIVCPSIENATSAVDTFTNIIDGWLSVDSSFYDNGSGARQAWEYFRDLANVAIIIILLVVIFSQITGYGINNYGIKKILPKLIVMSILINLSFIICQLAIDLSNIFGTGLNSLMKTIANNIENVDSSKATLASIVNGILGAIAGVGYVAGTAITIASIAGGGPMIVIFLVLSLLVALVSVLMFFVSLGARMIIIIVFAAISPLAFACYILPNTQNLFKKWWDIFKTALIMYPICGLLYGLSFVIKAIIFQSGTNVSLTMAMLAVVTPFIPFLILPSLLREALNKLGVIGGVINTLGNGLRKGFTGARDAVQNSDSYRKAQEMAKRRQDYKRAGYKRDKDGNYVLDESWRARRRAERANSRLGKAMGLNEMRDEAAQRMVAENAKNNERKNYGESAFVFGKLKQQDTENEINAKKVKDYNTKVYTDSWGNRFAQTKLSEGDTNWYSTDGKSEEIYSDEDVQKTMNQRKRNKKAFEAAGMDYTGRPAEFSTYASGIKNSAENERMQNLGKVLANATVDQPNALANAAMRSSTISTDIANADQLTAGQRNVLQVRQDKAAEQRRQTEIEGTLGHVAKSDDVIMADIMAKNNATRGTNIAIANMMTSGLPVAQNTASATMDAEKRLRGIASQNNAAKEVYSEYATDEARRNAVNVGKSKLVEQARTEILEGQEGYERKSDAAIRTDLQTRNNTVAGKNDAIANMQAQGIDTTLSREAAMLAAEKPLEGTAAQNEAATRLLNDANYDLAQKRQNAIAVGANNQVNQAKMEFGKKAPTEITVDYAKTLGERQFDTGQRTIYSEEFKNTSRGDDIKTVQNLMTNLNDPHRNDHNYMAVALDNLISKGGNEDFLNMVFNNSDNIKNLDLKTRNMIENKMATMPEHSAKQYSKYVNAMNDLGLTPGSYKEWMEGTAVADPSIDSSKTSWTGYLGSVSGDIKGGTKDEFKHLASNPVIYKQISPSNAVIAALDTKDVDTRTAANTLVNKIISGNDAAMGEALSTLNPRMAGNISDSTISAILGEDLNSITDLSKFGDETKNAIAKLKEQIYEPDGGVKRGLESVEANLSNGMKNLLKQSFKL